MQCSFAHRSVLSPYLPPSRARVCRADLVFATPKALAAADAWISRIEARGLTDIMTPLMATLSMLARGYARSMETGGSPGGLPFVFLLTDGCVDNERDICRAVEQVGRDMCAEGP